MSSELSTIIENVIKTARSGIRVSGIAEVSNYNHESQTVTATPLVKEVISILGVKVSVEIEPIEGVPVFWPSGGSRGLSFGLEDGDKVLLVFRTQSHDEIDDGLSDEISEPALSRRTSWGDVIAIPGYFAPSGNAGLGRSDGAPVLSMKNTDVFYVGDKSASKALSLAVETAQNLEALKLVVNSHTHMVAAVNAPSAVAVPQVGALADVASADIKVTK